MFGYLRPLVPELKVWEAQLYRGAYCGVCRALGRTGGHISRVCLQYDAAVLSLIWMLDRDKIDLEKRACLLHPGVPQPIVSDDPVLDAAARACLLLAYFRARDDVDDDGGICARGALAALSPCVRRACSRSSSAQESFDRLRELTAEIAALESEKCPDMDRMAELSGMTVAQVMLSYEGIGEDMRETLRWMGLQLGRWLYLADALDDMQRDAALGAYNVLLLQKDVSEARKLARDAAQWAAMQAANAFDLMPESGASHGIIHNLIYAGMPDTLRRVYESPRAPRGRRDKGDKNAGSV